MGEDCAGAASGTRTHDLFVTNEMLYQLSYCGDCGAKVRKILQILKHRLSIFCMTISVQVLRRPRKSGQRVGVRVCLL